MIRLIWASSFLLPGREMITLTFYTIAERRPKHGDWVICLDRRYDWDQMSFQPIEGQIDYCWFEKEGGRDTGVQIFYEPEETEEPEGCVLELMIGGTVLTADTLWCYPEEMHAAFTPLLIKSSV